MMELSRGGISQQGGGHSPMTNSKMGNATSVVERASWQLTVDSLKKSAITVAG